jgi:uncharacterized SAM-binding protein YcdF (DUF218 family)
LSNRFPGNLAMNPFALAVTYRRPLEILSMALPALLVSISVAHFWGLPTVGHFLVVADPLRSADAIFVVAGGTPARELEAAAIYFQRLAPRIALSSARDPLPEVARRLSGELAYRDRQAQVLTRVGMPNAAVIRLKRQVETPGEELQADFEYSQAERFRHIIIVTSPYHTRRVRLMWDDRKQRAVEATVHQEDARAVAAAR